MELWEGAILVVGGVFLVRYMTKNQQAAASLGAAATTADGSAGTTNASNLTDITNQAGGYPTIVGEPLEPPQPSVGAPSIPVSVSAQPIPTPVRSSPVLANLPKVCPAWGCGPAPVVKTPFRMPVKGTALPAPVSRTTAPAPAPAPVNPYAGNPIFGPLAAKAIAQKTAAAPTTTRTATAPVRTFTQAVPNLPTRPMDQHLEML